MSVYGSAIWQLTFNVVLICNYFNDVILAIIPLVPSPAECQCWRLLDSSKKVHNTYIFYLELLTMLHIMTNGNWESSPAPRICTDRLLVTDRRNDRRNRNELLDSSATALPSHGTPMAFSEAGLACRSGRTPAAHTATEA
jgi:hypothetical protein